MIVSSFMYFAVKKKKKQTSQARIPFDLSNMSCNGNDVRVHVHTLLSKKRIDFAGPFSFLHIFID